MAEDSLASHVTAAAGMVLHKPDGMSFAEAVTVPNAFLTAAVSLVDVAKLRPGQRVLVHAAAGGVGFSAVRLARRLGTEVIGTAGSHEKRAMVLAEGAAHAFDSRSASFADDVMRVTGGVGLDCVLNSLAGELIAAGMRVVRASGPGRKRRPALRACAMLFLTSGRKSPAMRRPCVPLLRACLQTSRRARYSRCPCAPTP